MSGGGLSGGREGAGSRRGAGNPTPVRRRLRRSVTPASRVTLAALCAIVLAGCGFALQGTGELPPQMRATFLETATPRSEFATALRRTLAGRGQPLVATRAEATAVLQLLQDEAGERILSVSATGVPEELELYHTVRFRVRAGNRLLVQDEELTVTRDFRYDPDDILGKRREAMVLKEAVVQDLVTLMLRRLDLLAREAA